MKKCLTMLLIPFLAFQISCEDYENDEENFSVPLDYNLLVGEWRMIKIVETSLFESETNTASESAYFVNLSLNEDSTFSWVGLVSLNGLWRNGNDEFDFIGIWSITEDILTIISGGNTFIYECTLNLIWFKFGIFLGKIVSPFIMGVIFFLVVTPTGLIMRLLGKDLLNLKFNDNKSYWIKKKDPKSKMKNQF